MVEYKIVPAKDKDMEILCSIKLVTMIDDEMDKALSYTEKGKIRKSVNKNIEMNCEHYKMIYIDNKIAGAYVVIPYDDGYIIDEIYLFEEFRNNGVGSDILRNLKKEYSNLYIWVYRNNVDAIRLFERLGFIVMSKGRTLIMKCDFVYYGIKNMLHEIKLGYRDKDGNFYSGFDRDFRDKFYFQSPKQLMISKIGTCFEQVELERDLISKLNVDLRTYFMSYSNDDYDMSHAFLIYKDGKKYYWLENAWLKYRGLHIYDDKESLLRDVLNKFVVTIPDGDIKKVKMYIYDKPRFGINYGKFLANSIISRSKKIK